MPGPDAEPSAITLLLHLAHFWTRGSYKRAQQAVTGRGRGILAESEYERGMGEEREREMGLGGSNRLQESLIDGRDGLCDGSV